MALSSSWAIQSVDTKQLKEIFTIHKSVDEVNDDDDDAVDTIHRHV